MEYDKNVDKEWKLPCESCDNKTSHKVLKSVGISEGGEWGFFWSDYEIILCNGCGTVSFRKAFGSDDIVGEDEDGEFIYEESVSLFPSRIAGRKPLKQLYLLPAKVQSIYRETHKAIASSQPILACIGIGVLVETICNDKDAKGKDLEAQIDKLVEMGVLTKEGAQILHQTRKGRNVAAHETLELKEADLDILMNIAENLLTNVYILPAQTLEYQERIERQKTKKKTI